MRSGEEETGTDMFHGHSTAPNLNNKWINRQAASHRRLFLYKGTIFSLINELFVMKTNGFMLGFVQRFPKTPTFTSIQLADAFLQNAVQIRTQKQSKVDFVCFFGA